MARKINNELTRLSEELNPKSIQQSSRFILEFQRSAGLLVSLA